MRRNSFLEQVYQYKPREKKHLSECFFLLKPRKS
nr:MAG TPA: hypothetical protein [Caudoviricetes sp.]